MALTSSRPDATVEPVLGQALPHRRADQPPARSAPLDAAKLDPGAFAAPPVDPDAERQAKVHIRADGEVIIDLTDGDSSPTTDMVCPNCGGRLHVDSVDTDIRAAHMECQDCRFRFAQRLSLRTDERRETVGTAGSAGEAKRGRFLRRSPK